VRGEKTRSTKLRASRGALKDARPWIGRRETPVLRRALTSSGRVLASDFTVERPSFDEPKTNVLAHRAIARLKKRASLPLALSGDARPSDGLSGFANALATGKKDAYRKQAMWNVARGVISVGIAVLAAIGTYSNDPRD
jgi:hypothetical protein